MYPTNITVQRSCSYALLFLIRLYSILRILHSFPTRRSSDLGAAGPTRARARRELPPHRRGRLVDGPLLRGDRKSTRLNSSHPSNSYAVSCLKKKSFRDYAHNAYSSSHGWSVF